MTRLDELPDALERLPELERRLAAGVPVVFLDYDGTLTPIVERPEDAVLDDDVRAAVAALASRLVVAVVSGRDLDDVRARVGLPELVYAGSHGFDILLPDGTRHRQGERFRPALAAAADALTARLDRIGGAHIEHKRYAVAVHTRRIEDPDQAATVERIAREVGEAHDGVRVTGGKRIVELRPDLDWDKGRAVRALLDRLAVVDAVPVYLGDDVTDEDAFRAVADDGIGIVVRGEDDDRASAAAYALADPRAAAQLLRALGERWAD